MNGKKDIRRPPVRTGRAPAKPASKRAEKSDAAGLPMERLIRIERRKARNRAVSLSIMVLLIMLATVLMILVVMQRAKPAPSLVFVQQGVVEHTQRVTALIIRDETTLTAPASGLLKPQVTEGSRASKGQKLALIIPEDKQDELSELRKCENDIVLLQTELMNAGKVPGAQAIFAESDAALGAIINLIRSDASNGTLSNLGAYSASIDVILENRTARLMTVNFRDARLDDLASRKAVLEQSLGLLSGTLYSPQSGIVSYRIDGLENNLTPAAAATITPSLYDQYCSDSSMSSRDSDLIMQDEPVLRLAANLDQHLVFLLSDTSADRFLPGDLFDVRVPNDGLTIGNCRVIRAEDHDGDAFLVVATDQKVERYIDRRTIEAEVTISATKGLKVPVGALIAYDPDSGQAGLMVVSRGFTRICQVDVLDADREFAIIKARAGEDCQIAVATVLVVNPDSIEAGEFIGN